ncbi:MAG: HAD family phosphatase [Gammaproteobacteria bacterium]|nr:HAD family phosphatase [Gammaproteobacteria bacterium]
MNLIKAVLFDIDGVLIDAKDWHYEALNKALSLFGMEISLYDHLGTYDGLPTRKKLEMLTVERGLPVELHAFLNEVKQQRTLEEVYQKCKPMFIHEYALSRLKNEGKLLAACSNSIRNTVRIMLEKAMLIQYFDAVFSNQDVTKGKPDPEIYIKCMDKLGVKPHETLILEDNEYGIKAAIASGAHLLPIQTVNDVTYFNIKARIDSLNMGAN